MGGDTYSLALNSDGKRMRWMYRRKCRYRNGDEKGRHSVDTVFVGRRVTQICLIVTLLAIFLLVHHVTAVPGITTSKTRVEIGEQVTFTVAGFGDPDCYPTDYTWDFGDGSGGGGSVATHAYTYSGTFSINLQVRNSCGGTQWATAQVIVNPRKYDPVASFTVSDSNPAKGDSVSFDASGSYDPDGGNIVYYTWDFGDGSGEYTERDPFIIHYFSSPGTYYVRLEVLDNEEQTDQAGQSITVRGLYAPVGSFIISPEHPGPGETIRFDASSSYDTDGTITGYSWEFGDNTKYSGVYVTHSFRQSGRYLVTLTVTDHDGLTASHSRWIDVEEPVTVTATTVSPTTATQTTVPPTNVGPAPDGDGFPFWIFVAGAVCLGGFAGYHYHQYYRPVRSGFPVDLQAKGGIRHGCDAGSACGVTVECRGGLEEKKHDKGEGVK